MKIHHIRNATMVIEAGGHSILVDPMLGKKGTGLPFTLFRFKPRINPLVDLPENAMGVVNNTTHCLITHLHPDHIDAEGEKFLRRKNPPVICSNAISDSLKRKKLNVGPVLVPWKEQSFLGGSILGIPAKHGYGFIAGFMGKVMGFFLKLPNEPSVYISSDTIYTADVDRALMQLRPDISVLACGSAQLDIGRELLMHMDDLIRFINTAPGKVIANHMEALNHCPTRRPELRQAINRYGLNEKVFIPNDGESIQF